MSRSFTPIVNTNTFGVWKDRTNEIIAAFDDVVTIGDSETNTGNVVIDGGITSNDITLDQINVKDGSANIITLDSNFRVNGEVNIYSLSADPQANRIEFYLDTGLEWTLSPSDDHTRFNFSRGIYTMFIDSTNGLLDSNSMKIAARMLPDNLGDKNIDGNAATATAWANNLTLNFTGDVTGTATFDGDEGTLNVPIDVTSGTANSWATARTVSFSGGDVTGNFSIKGDADVTGVNLQVVNDSHTHDLRYYTKAESESRYVNVTGDSMSGNLNVLTNSTTGVRVNTNGTILASGDISAFANISDINRKKNIEKIENALDKVIQLSGYTFDYIDNDERMTGLIAQEVEEVLPEVIYDTQTVDNEATKAVRYGNMMGLIVEAIKELKSEIDEIKSQL